MAQTETQTKADELLNKGDYLFKAGYYLKASEHYRLALLEDPNSPDKKLAFGHSLFAIGNYSYASYALRRGVAEIDEGSSFRPEVATLFPSRRAFTQALRDLKRYVTYSPRDPAGLTVLGYVLFSVNGEERRCRDMFMYLKRLDRDDPFAAFFLTQLERRTKLPPYNPKTPFPRAEPVDPDEQPPRTPTPSTFPPPEPSPKAKPQPKKAPSLKKVVPEPTRLPEQSKSSEWPEPVPSMSD